MEMGIEIEIEGVGGIYIFKLINNFFFKSGSAIITHILFHVFNVSQHGNDWVGEGMVIVIVAVQPLTKPLKGVKGDAARGLGFQEAGAELW